MKKGIDIKRWDDISRNVKRKYLAYEKLLKHEKMLDVACQQETRKFAWNISNCSSATNLNDRNSR